jgi:hypothetical protein
MRDVTYKVFSRSATSWESFATARKTVKRRGLSLQQAREMCAGYNDNRTQAQIRRGTKYEFTTE